MDIAEEHVANITIVEVKGPLNSNTAKKLGRACPTRVPVAQKIRGQSFP